MKSDSEGNVIDKAFYAERSSSEAAEAMEGDISLTLSDEQRKQLETYLSRTGRFPSSIEINMKTGFDRSTLIPVTVLVGAMA